MSGIVNLQVKDGGKDYHGSLSYQSGDHQSDDSRIFTNIDNFNLFTNKVFEGTINGPMPFIRNRDQFTFNLSARLSDSEGYFYGVREHTVGDSADFRDDENWYIEMNGDSSFVPMSPSNNINLMGKFTYKVSPLMKLSLQLLHSGGESKSYSHAYKYNPDGTSTSLSANNNYSLKLNHALNARNFYEANISLSNTNYMGYQFKPIDLSSSMDQNEAERFGSNKYVLHNYFEDSSKYWILNEHEYAPSSRIKGSPSSPTFLFGGSNRGHSYRKSNSLSFKFDFTSQINNRHEIKTGINYRSDKLDERNFSILFDNQEYRIPTILPENDSPSHSHYNNKSVFLSGYIQDKIEYDNFVKINEKHKNAWLKTVWYNSIFFPIAELSTSITIGLIVWFGGLNAILEDSSITLGVIFLFIQLSQMLFRPLRQIADKFNTLQMGMVAANRIFKIIDTDSKIQNSGKNIGESLDGSISFKNVNFSYNQNETIINNLSFSIKNGEKIAIVGSTGSGKTTIVNLITRFYDIQGGSIFLGKNDIKEYKLSSLRSKIALVLQDVFLFADTILNNITLYNPNISFDHVVSAAKKIGIHDFIMSMPGGYNYNVKERGVMLSQGQRQLISFLRAYIKNPSILILDEATSSIDSNSEELIQRATLKITENKTSIIIAHRLSTIVNSDRIFVMNGGELVESGSHKELIKKKNGYYKNLYDVQFKNEKFSQVPLPV